MGRYFDEANFGRWRFGKYGPPYVGTLASVILLANLTHTRQYRDADEILWKATTKTPIYAFF
jgi:hypothetical protein